MNYEKMHQFIKDSDTTFEELAQKCDMSYSGFQKQFVVKSMKVETLETIVDHFGLPFDYFSESRVVNTQLDITSIINRLKTAEREITLLKDRAHKSVKKVS